MKLHLLVGIGALLFICCAAAYVAFAPAEPAKAPPLPGEAVAGEPVTTPSGLKYYDIKVGEGPTPAGRTSRVRCNYTGYLTSGKVFDSSAKNGGPQTFGLNQVIPGWTEGVGSMKVGGKRKLVVPARLGYGAAGQGEIPPNATLVFDIELVGLE
jgi:peptidylprolyl isomerase